MRAHGAVASKAFGSKAVESLLGAGQTEGLSRKLQAALAMIGTMTLQPDALNTGEVTLLRSLGTSWTALMDLIYICVGFNIINRIADAMKVEILSEQALSRSAYLLYFFGYRILAGWPSFGRVVPARRQGDRFREGLTRLEEAVTRGQGKLDPSIRMAAVYGGELVQPLRQYVEKIRASGLMISDDDIGCMLKAGFSEDQVFEVTIAAALSAGLVRLESARRAVVNCA